MERIANISKFESLMNGSDNSVMNGFFGRMKTGAANLASQARYNMGRWAEHGTNNYVTKQAMAHNDGMTEAFRNRVASELLASDFLGFADKLYLAGSQVAKYAKMWLVGKRNINIGKFDYLVREAYAAARSALNVLRASLSQR